MDEPGQGIREPQDSSVVPMARPADVVLSHERAVPASQANPLLIGQSRRAALIDLVVVFGVIVGAMVGKDFLFLDYSDEELRDLTPLMIGILGVFSALVILLYVRRRGQPFSSLGLSWRRWLTDSGIGIVAAAFVMTLMVAGSLFVWIVLPDLIPALQESQENIKRVLPPMTVSTIVGLTVVVSFYEELLFRGFLLTRLRVLTRTWWAAVLLGAVGFAMLHFYQGPVAVLAIVLLSGVLSVVFLWRRSLVAPMVAHFVFNVTQLIMMQFALRGME